MKKNWEVKTENGANFVKDNNVKFYETSTKDVTNDNEVFELLAREIVWDTEKLQNKNKRSSQILKKKNTEVEKKIIAKWIIFKYLKLYKISYKNKI